VGDEFEIGIGCCWDSEIKTWQRILSFGPRVAGFSATPRTLKAKNTSGATRTDCRLYATNAIRIENNEGPGRPFEYFFQWGILNPAPDSDLNGAEITFTNYAFGAPPTVDMLVNGNSIDILDVLTNEIVPGGMGLKCGIRDYQFADGTKYQSGTFRLSADLEEADTATIYVSDGGSSVWLTTENGGLFVRGPAGLVLTETGQAEGTITDNGEVSFRILLASGTGDVPNLNMRSFSLRPVGMDGDDIVSEEHQGSFLLARGDALLSFRINSVLEAYPRPRYSEYPENSGQYIPDDTGAYVEDLTSPGSFIFASEAPNQGNYRNIWDYLAENGVVVESV